VRLGAGEAAGWPHPSGFLGFYVLGHLRLLSNPLGYSPHARKYIVTPALGEILGEFLV
jgi:hypothetical protein